MGTRAHTRIDYNDRAPVPPVDYECVVITWTGLLNGDDGTPVLLPGHADRTAHVLGTFGAGGTVLMELELIEGVYFTGNDLFGNPLSITAAGGYGVAEASYGIRPRVSAGDGTTNITVHLFVRRPA